MPSPKPILTQVPAQTYIPYHVPSIGEEEIAEVVDTLKSGWLTTGPKTARFEKEMAAFVGAPCTVAVNSCTAGLHLALAAADLRPGDEVLTSPYTFAATAEVIIACGGRPVFVDVEANGFNMDPDKIERAVTQRSRAIIPVHFAGEPCRMDEIKQVAQRHSLRIIEDAAHALGASYHGQKVGALSAREISRIAKERRAGSLGYAESMLIAYNKKMKTGLQWSKLYQSQSSISEEDSDAEDEEELEDSEETNVL